MKTILFVLIWSAMALADVNGPYDLCRGEFPAGGFPVTRQRFQLHARNYDDASASVSFHLEGPVYGDFSFAGKFDDTSSNRDYVMHETYTGDHFLTIKMDRSKCEKDFCNAILTTDLSGEKVSLKVGCSLDMVDYPAPPNPPQCNHPHCI